MDGYLVLSEISFSPMDEEYSRPDLIRARVGILRERAGEYRASADRDRANADKLMKESGDYKRESSEEVSEPMSIWRRNLGDDYIKVADMLMGWADKSMRRAEEAMRRADELTRSADLLMQNTGKVVLKRVRVGADDDDEKEYGSSESEDGGDRKRRKIVRVSEKESCAVCLEDFKLEEVASVMTCSHFFHDKCIVTWLKRSPSCPLCRFSGCSTS